MHRSVKDQMGEIISVPDFPTRIVSLVPSQTELLHDLGLGERVVGITKFCVHPKEWFQTKTRVGGTKQVKLEAVKSLAPDFIIGNKEENTREDIEALRKIAPVWMSDIETLDHAQKMIVEIGALTNTLDKAKEIAAKIHTSFQAFSAPLTGKTVLYLIWKNPYMGAAEGTFIHDLLTNVLQLKNGLTPQKRYPAIDFDNFKEQPDYIFLSSEPFPFNESHILELEQRFPKSKVILVDGEYFSWYGSRLLGTVDYFKRLALEL
jgi:ABC-type Fe3+-hydroxamate transport system substrate-binding protein